jgi:hypothetical protein
VCAVASASERSVRTLGKNAALMAAPRSAHEQDARLTRAVDAGSRNVGDGVRRGRGLPSRPQREVAPDPARLERAATLTNCGLGAPLPGGCALGGFGLEVTRPVVPAGRRGPRLSCEAVAASY